ncbi:MAG: transglutaminase-like domain-containing protein [Deltaproteobacteria bacterium]|nr:transglutaminase-like domain-containing protein [Deltaproteobacteria bacterium]
MGILLVACSSLSPAPTASEEAREKGKDLWYVVELLGQRAGYFRIESRPIRFEGNAAWRTEETLRNELTRRNGGATETVVVVSRTTLISDAAGNTLRIENVLDQGGGETSSVVEVNGNKAFLTQETDGDTRRFEMPWDEEVVGPQVADQAIEAMLAGDSEEVSYQVFSFEAGNRTLEMKARVIERREDGSTIVEQDFVGLGAKTREVYDRDAILLRQEVGPVVLRLASRAEALEPLESTLQAFDRMTVTLDRPLPMAGELRKASFRLVPREPGDEISVGGMFIQDGRQRVALRGGGEILVVDVPSEPWQDEANSSFDPRDYLAASSLIENDDPEIQAVARHQAGDLSNPLSAARRLERWVHENVAFLGSGIGLATARQTLKSRDGDCTENAFLLAALLRAVDIPSRVVVGLVSVGSQGQPAVFVPHAWVEGYVGGWVAFDSAVYGPPVDAAHLSMAKSAGGEEGALLEITVPLLEALGRFDLAWVD